MPFMRYSTARSGLWKAARKARTTSSRGKPISQICMHNRSDGIAHQHLKARQQLGHAAYKDEDPGIAVVLRQQRHKLSHSMAHGILSTSRLHNYKGSLETRTPATVSRGLRNVTDPIDGGLKLAAHQNGVAASCGCRGAHSSCWCGCRGCGSWSRCPARAIIS